MMAETEDAISLLRTLISTPSVSGEEKCVADAVEKWLNEHGVTTSRWKNNIWAVAGNYDGSRPTLLINSHLDTVKPSPAYTRDPFTASVEDGKIFGLGSNDAGGSAVSLATAFIKHKDKRHNYNLILALTAEEENGGENGMRGFLPVLEENCYKPDMALVGEPTGLQPAIGERGLVVLDCTAHGKTGHAAREEGVNALYKAIEDIQRLREFKFPKKSDLLGDIKVSVTQIEAGRQHNVVPDECRFVVDVRTTDAYTNAETAEMLGMAIESDCKPRSTRVWASAIDRTHPLVRTAIALGGEPFVSPTTSDMSQLHNIPSLKVGPGESKRSHSADEYVEAEEIRAGIAYYDNFLTKLNDFLR